MLTIHAGDYYIVYTANVFAVAKEITEVTVKLVANTVIKVTVTDGTNAVALANNSVFIGNTLDV